METQEYLAAEPDAEADAGLNAAPGILDETGDDGADTVLEEAAFEEAPAEEPAPEDAHHAAVMAGPPSHTSLVMHEGSTAAPAAGDGPVWLEAASLRPPALIPIPDKMLAYRLGLTFHDFAGRAGHFSATYRIRKAETRIAPGQQAHLLDFPDTLHILALVTVDDPDTVAVLPIVAHLAERSQRIDLRVLTDEDDLAPLALLLPDVDVVAGLEEWDLPLFFVFNEDWELETQWGPRPAAAEKPLEEWLARHTEYEALAEDESLAGQLRYAALLEELVHEMRVWYNSTLARACIDEWMELLAALQAEPV